MKILRKIVALLCAGSMMLACTACGGGGDNSSTPKNSSVETSSDEVSSEDVSSEDVSEEVSEEVSEDESEETSEETNSETSVEFESNDVPVQANFDMDGALADADGWEGVLTNNPVLDTTNGFLTFRKKSSQAIGYSTVGMSSGTVEFQMKVDITSDTTACFVFSNQAKKLDDFCYKPAGKSYALEFSWDETANKGKMFIKKWENANETVLSGSASSADVPLTLKSRLTAVKVEVVENGNSVNIKAYVGGSLKLDVTDSNNPILGGGAVGLSYTSTTGVMVVGGKNSVSSNYVAPPEPKLTVYDQPNVTVANTNVDLMANFANDWTGRNRIFNTEETANGVKFSSVTNPEEPQAGVTEYQGMYTKKIFGDMGFTYNFTVQSHGEWIMFWFKCMPESSTNVSVWGNKSTRENSNGYSVLITCDGYIQIHKWADFSQIWLNGQGKKLPGSVMNKFSNPSETITLEMEMYQETVGGKDVMTFWVSIGGTEITVQDTDTPFLNAGYAGVQGYAIGGGNCAITIKNAEAYTI